MGNRHDKPAKSTTSSQKAAVPYKEIKDYENHYEIKMDLDHRIGGGTFGNVFRITRKSDGRVLAMKVSKSEPE